MDISISFLSTVEAWKLALILFVLMLLSISCGLYVGRKRESKSNSDTLILGTLFSILGLLLAFSFSLSVSRFEMRRKIIVEEANCIEVALLRIDLYDSTNRQFLRSEFKKYVEARIDYFTSGADIDRALSAQGHAVAIQKNIWRHAASLGRDGKYYLASLENVPALNAMFEIKTTQLYLNLAHLPDVVVYLLFLLSCSCAFYIGYVFSTKERFDWLQKIGYCLLISLVVYVDLDMDRARRGLIRHDEDIQSIVDLRGMFSADGNRVNNTTPLNKVP
jgi:hypothetical protein